jgi:hypothetical protein
MKKETLGVIIFELYRSALVSGKSLFQMCITAIIIALFFTSCGGGSVPGYLREAKVDISKWTPTKEVVLKKDSLNLVKAIVPLQDSTEFLIVSDNRVCRLSNFKLNTDYKVISPELSNNLFIVRNISGEPSYIVGGGLWGKPSVAVFDINGQLKWKKEYGFDAMGKTAVLDDGNERFVVLNKNDSALFVLNFETGEIVHKGPPARILASADFTGDEHHEILIGLGEVDFAVLDGKAQVLSRLSVSQSYWYEPVVTSSVLPFVVLSAGDTLAVYDSNLKFLRKFDAVGAPSPMHVVAATFIGNAPNAPFAAVYNGRGGWHRSILYVFSTTGDLVYKEILDGDYQSICPVKGGDKMEFLLGGRNEVLLYSFNSKNGLANI